VHYECQLFLAGVTESIVVAVFEDVGGGVAGIGDTVQIAVEVVRSEIAGVGNTVGIAV
jgi:hypothetical protein